MRWKNFYLLFRSSSATTAKVSDIRPKIVRKNKNVLSVERIIHMKDAQIKKQENLNVLTVRGHMLHLTMGVRNTKGKRNRHSGNMRSTSKKHMPKTVNQNTLPQPKTNTETFTFADEQLTKFVANVVIQIVQPQVCYPNPKGDTINLKSSMCCKVSNAAETILDLDISGKALFESIDPLSAPVSPCTISSRAPKSNQSPKAFQKHSKSIHYTNIHHTT